jgi:hypothetical protein
MPPPVPRTTSLLLPLAAANLAAHTSRPPPLRTRLLLFPRAARLFSSCGVSAAAAEPRTPTAYKFHAAASVSAKTDRLDLSRNTYEHARHDGDAKLRPWPPRGGHDAFFVSDAATGGGGGGGSGADSGRDAAGGRGRGSGGGALAFGVADGVGGWVDSGVNPADFSQRLCRHMARAAAAGVLSAPAEEEEYEDEDEGGEAGTGSPRRRKRRRQRQRLLHPVELLEEGYARVLADDGVFAGGSTACVATASRNGVLEVAKYVPLFLFSCSSAGTYPTDAFVRNC